MINANVCRELQVTENEHLGYHPTRKWGSNKIPPFFSDTWKSPNSCTLLKYCTTQVPSQMSPELSIFTAFMCRPTFIFVIFFPFPVSVPSSFTIYLLSAWHIEYVLIYCFFPSSQLKSKAGLSSLFPRLCLLQPLNCAGPCHTLNNHLLKVWITKLSSPSRLLHWNCFLCGVQPLLLPSSERLCTLLPEWPLQNLIMQLFFKSFKLAITDKIKAEIQVGSSVPSWLMLCSASFSGSHPRLRHLSYIDQLSTFPKHLTSSQTVVPEKALLSSLTLLPRPWTWDFKSNDMSSGKLFGIFPESIRILQYRLSSPLYFSSLRLSLKLYFCSIIQWKPTFSKF